MAEHVEYDSSDELISSYKRLSKAVVEPAFSLYHWLTCSIYYRDPTATMSSCSDNFGDWAASPESMRMSPAGQDRHRPAAGRPVSIGARHLAAPRVRID